MEAVFEDHIAYPRDAFFNGLISFLSNSAFKAPLLLVSSAYIHYIRHTSDVSPQEVGCQALGRARASDAGDPCMQEHRTGEHRGWGS